jgi:uncharacterized protein involved in outer membrane biogenesis
MLLWFQWDWNWFRPLAERQATAALGREVRLGSLAVEVGWQPRVVVRGITVANPAGFAGDPGFAEVRQLALRFDLRALLDRQLELRELTLDTPVVNLRGGEAGRGNWLFDRPPSDQAVKPWRVEVHHLTLNGGQFSFVNPRIDADIRGTMATRETPPRPGVEEGTLEAKAEGRLRGKAFTGRFVGGSVLALHDAAKPYPVDVLLEAATTRIAVSGDLTDPVRLGGARLVLDWSGSDLAALADVTGLPLPATPPYRLKGRLDLAPGELRLNGFEGLLGESDVSGDLKLQLIKPRPRLTATVRSKQLRLADLSGFIGDDPNTAKPKGRGARVLPAEPLSVPRLDNMDATLDFNGARIRGGKLPVNRLAFQLTLQDGVLRVSPADFGIGEGALRLFATLDPRGGTLGLDAEAELIRVDVSDLMARTGYRGKGRIGGVAAITSRGRSVAEWLAGGDGSLKLAMAGGDFPALLLDLAGLDFGNAALSLAGVTPRTEVRCLVGDFGLTKGELDTKSFVLDTGTTNVLLDGGANFANETLRLKLRTQPKRANIARIKAPIHIRGTFADPDVQPDYRDLALRAGAVVALGVVLAPVAAVLPTVQLGSGADADCQALLKAAKAPIKPAAR